MANPTDLICSFELKRIENGYLIACHIPDQQRPQVLYFQDFSKLGDLVTTFLVEEKLNESALIKRPS